MGGLGNQMFQYALGRHLSLINKDKLKLDLSGYNKQPSSDTLRNYELSIFDIPKQIINISKNKLLTGNGWYHRILNRLGLNYKYVKEKNKFFNKEILKLNGNLYLNGYWQCEDYFKNIRKTLLKEFTVQSKLNKKNRLMLKRIKTASSVVIHIRRTDYVNSPKTNKYHGGCTLNYYKKAVKKIKNKIKNPVFFVFSDDIEWCRKNVKLGGRVVFVNINNPKKGYEDLRLMKNCKHFITTNSSFSWWGAWLSENKNKIIIAPQDWFNYVNEGSLIPKSWIRVKN